MNLIDDQRPATERDKSGRVLQGGVEHALFVEAAHRCGAGELASYQRRLA
jgi:hypothetical protein